MKTSDLIGLPLDWAVAKVLGITEIGAPEGRTFESEFFLMHDAGDFNYSANWSQGGPIIEREDISFRKYHNPKSEAHGTYYAKVCRESGSMVHWSKRRDSTGPTPLIAAMRCYVASKLGDEVDVPEELQ